MNIAIKILSGSRFGQSIEFELNQLWVGLESGELFFSGERSSTVLAQIHKTADGWFFTPLAGSWRIENFGIKEKVRLKSGNVISNESGSRFEFVIGRSFSIPGETSPNRESQKIVAGSGSTSGEQNRGSEPDPPPLRDLPENESVNSPPVVLPKTTRWARNPMLIGGSILGTLLVGFVIWTAFSDSGNKKEQVADKSGRSTSQEEKDNDQEQNNKKKSNQQQNVMALPQEAVVWIGVKEESLIVPFCTAIRVNRSRVVVPARFLEVIESDQEKDFFVFFDQGFEAKITHTVFPGGYQKHSKKMQRWNFGFAHFNPPPGLTNSTVDSIPKKELTKLDLMNDYRFSVIGFRFSKTELANKSISSSLMPPRKSSILRVEKINPEINGIPVIEVSGELDGFFGAAIINEQGQWCGMYDDFFFFTDQKDF